MRYKQFGKTGMQVSEMALGTCGIGGVGWDANPEETRALRADGIVKTPEDLGIDPARANRSLLAAKNVRDLVKWSGGLYQPPGKFKNW